MRTRMHARAPTPGVTRVVVDKAAGVVRIRGPDADCVARARAIMDFAVARVPLAADEVPFIMGPGGSTFRKLREDSRVINMDVDQVGSLPSLFSPRTPLPLPPLQPLWTTLALKPPGSCSPCSWGGCPAPRVP